MATLLNTLLATLFPALLASNNDSPVAIKSETTKEVTVVSQEETESDVYRVYVYPQSGTSHHS